MKFLLTVLLYLGFLTAESQDTINWSNGVKLTWNDFIGMPDTNSKYAAVTNATIKYSLSANEDSFRVKIVCFFKKSKSWSKNKQSTALLLHEQGHFDIAELYARKLRKAIEHYHFNYATVGKDIDRIFLDNKRERANTDSLYDRQTQLSMNSKQQIAWTRKIACELEKLKDYSSGIM